MVKINTKIGQESSVKVTSSVGSKGAQGFQGVQGTRGFQGIDGEYAGQGSQGFLGSIPKFLRYSIHQSASFIYLQFGTSSPLSTT